MPGEDEELAEEKASHMEEGRLLIVMRKVAVIKLPNQQIKVIMRKVMDHISEAGEMVEEEELGTNVIGVIRGDIDHLSVVRYKDKVICNIMPMDVCHILLGRPWQYDRKVVHDGLTNCYKFVKDGIKHTIVPIKEEGTIGTSEPRALLVSKKQFLKQVQDSEMLQEFTDKVVDDLPNKLPPIRSISHHIDFIPGASLPNKAAYRMSPKDNEEIRNQVQELLDKGLVKESLSPCAVPTVLAPNKGGEWRMCTDLRDINKITIRYRFPLPQMEDMMDFLSGATYFSKIYLKSEYHQI
eukprot:PITA_06624